MGPQEITLDHQTLLSSLSSVCFAPQNNGARTAKEREGARAAMQHHEEVTGTSKSSMRRRKIDLVRL